MLYNTNKKTKKSFFLQPGNTQQRKVHLDASQQKLYCLGTKQYWCTLSINKEVSDRAKSWLSTYNNNTMFVSNGNKIKDIVSNIRKQLKIVQLSNTFTPRYYKLFLEIAKNGRVGVNNYNDLIDGCNFNINACNELQILCDKLYENFNITMNIMPKSYKLPPKSYDPLPKLQNTNKQKIGLNLKAII
jgi:hypothetical protein